MYKRDYEKIKPNEKCHCGSDLKYKKCCLKKIRNAEQQTYEDIYARRRLLEKARQLEEDKIKVAEAIEKEKTTILLPGKDF